MQSAHFAVPAAYVPSLPLCENGVTNAYEDFVMSEHQNFPDNPSGHWAQDVRISRNCIGLLPAA